VNEEFQFLTARKCVGILQILVETELKTQQCVHCRYCDWVEYDAEQNHSPQKKKKKSEHASAE
jgi:hypothetical protein